MGVYNHWTMYMYIVHECYVQQIVSRVSTVDSSSPIVLRIQGVNSIKYNLNYLQKY